MEKKCHYFRDGECSILNTECAGCNEKCSFMKTSEEHWDSLNKAILHNRENGVCQNCKYTLPERRCLCHCGDNKRELPCNTCTHHSVCGIRPTNGKCSYYKGV